MTAAESQRIVEEFFAFAVSRKVRGEGRYAIHANTLSSVRIGVGETRGQAWKDAARRVLLMAKARLQQERAP